MAPHWREYIDSRLDADPTSEDPDPQERALEWVTRYATIDGVPGPGWDGRFARHNSRI